MTPKFWCEILAYHRCREKKPSLPRCFCVLITRNSVLFAFNFNQEMNISVSDVVDMNSDLETTTTPTDAEILGLPSCAPSISDESENENNCGDELERVTQSEVTSCHKVTQSEVMSCLEVTQSEVTSCLEQLNVYIMQANCNKSVTLPFLKFKDVKRGPHELCKETNQDNLAFCKVISQYCHDLLNRFVVFMVYVNIDCVLNMFISV